jgi:hypothetical protein
MTHPILPEGIKIEFRPHAPLPSGEFTMNGKRYMNTADGGMMPVEMIKPLDLLKDEVVRKVLGYGIALSQQVSRFLGHTFDDIGGLEALMAQEYKARLGGKKGNITLFTFDGLYKLEVRVQARLDFGPELQVAKALFDECLNEWSADTRAELRAIVTRAFNTDDAGKISRSGIFMLLRTESDDERWQNAVRAIRDAMIVVGSKTYVRMWMRPTCESAFTSVTIDLAKA